MRKGKKREKGREKEREPVKRAELLIIQGGKHPKRNGHQTREKEGGIRKRERDEGKEGGNSYRIVRRKAWDTYLRKKRKVRKERGSRKGEGNKPIPILEGRESERWREDAEIEDNPRTASNSLLGKGK